MSKTYAQLGKSAIVTYEMVRQDIFAEEKATNELLGRLAQDIVGATGYEGEYVIKLWRTIDKDPFRQQDKIDVCADVAQVRHGHWIEEQDRIVCSECGARFRDEIIYMQENKVGVPHRCLECGAIMDEEENDGTDDGDC